MLEKLERRLEAQGITNVRTLKAGLGEGALEGEAFDRVLLAFVLGEVRDRAAAAHELYAALKPGGILSVSEGFGDPDYRRPTTVRREVEPAGFRLVEHFGGFPAYTLNFQKPEKEEVGSVVLATPGTGTSVLLPAIGGVFIGLGLVMRIMGMGTVETI